MAHTDETREQTVAMIFLETWGSTSYPPQRFEYEDREGHKHALQYAESGYAPEWLSESDDLDGCDRDSCVTVLSYGSTPVAPKGMRVVYSYQAGEKECPECEAKGKLPAEDWIPEELHGTECGLCEGDGYLYEGEECQVVVFGPAISYGSGQEGCLYDDGPHLTDSVESAIDALVEDFDHYFDSELTDPSNMPDVSEEQSFTDEEWEAMRETCEAFAETELATMRAALASDGIFRFSRPGLAGAHYCEITDLGK